MWPDFLSDARPLDTGPAPRRNTEGGIQPADKSLINRRLKRSISLLCADSSIKHNGFDLLDRSKWSLLLDRRFSLDHGHKSYFPAQNSWDRVLRRNQRIGDFLQG